MSETTSQYTLNLDAEQFTAAANNAASALTSVGEAGASIGVLIETLEHIGLALGVLTVAFLAIKKTVDAVFDSEKIRATENQFKILSTQAGVYGETLMRGLTESSRGWVTHTELMEHANKAMVELETGVDKLPELMEAARKATAVMGGDLMSNFDDITRAVATGNTRMLRHLGIIIDQKVAYRDYAKSIGETVDTLSLAGRQEAIMAAVIAQTNLKFKGQGEEIKVNIGLWQQTKAVFTELYEIVTLVIGKLAGSTLARWLTGVHESALMVKKSLTEAFGTGVEKVESLEEKIKLTKAALDRMAHANRAAMSASDIQLLDRAIADTTKQLALQEAQLHKLRTTDKEYLAEQKQHHAQVIALEADKVVKSKVDLDVKKKQRAEFNKELASMEHEIGSIDKKVTDAEIKNMESVEQANKLYNKQRLQNVKEVETQITMVKAKQEELRAKAAQGHITEAQKVAAIAKTDQQIVQLNKLKDQQMMRDDDAQAKMQQKALDNYVRHSKTAYEGVGRSFKAMSAKNKAAMQDMGQFGTMTTDAFASHSVSSIQAWAAGHKSATKAVEGMFAGMAGQMATEYGTVMFLSSIWPPNPLGLAGGAALIALGTMLSSLGSDSGVSAASGVSMPSMSGGGGGGGGMADTGASLPTGTAAQTQKQSATHITVMGSIFDTDATRTRMTDLVRSAQDSTDFSIARIGGGV